MTIEDNITCIIENVPVACCLLDGDYNVLHSNRGIVSLLGLENLEDAMRNFGDLSPPHQPNGVPSYAASRNLMADCLESGETATFEWLYSNHKNKPIPTLITMQRVALGDGWGLMVFTQDIRQFQRANMIESISHQRFKAMLDSCPLACGIVDEGFNIVECNQEAVNLFKLESKEMFMKQFFDLSPEYQPDGRTSLQKAFDKLKQTFEAGRIKYEWLHQDMRGEQIPCEVTLVRVHVGEQDIAIMYIHDLREIKRTVEVAEKMQSIAYTDELTKLFTRRYFMINAEETLDLCKAENKEFHLVMLDLDHFKAVNDNYGHLVGDEVLKILSARMGNVVRNGTIIARYGGEEFIILLPEMCYDAAVKTAQRIQKSVEEYPFMVSKLKIPITVSLGVSTLISEEDTLNDVIHRADVALYAAKRTGRNKVMEYKNIEESDKIYNKNKK